MTSPVRAMLGSMIGGGVFALLAWLVFLRSDGAAASGEEVEHQAASIGAIATLVGAVIGMIVGVSLGRQTRPAENSQSGGNLR